MLCYKILIADKVICVTSNHKHTKQYCQKYLCTKDNYSPNILINITEEDIVLEAEKNDFFHLSLNTYSCEYFELLALHRNIALELLDYSFLLIHGSAISVDGKAYLFIAPSGTGKSTHTRLWREHFGHRALMVNDDKPLIKITDNMVYACGSPWSGKHRLDNNVMVPSGNSIRIWDYVNSGNTLLRTVVGISMEPLLHARTSVVKFEKPNSKLEVNDVVLFMRPNGDYVFHRIVKVRKDDYLICGDNQIWYEVVPKDLVVGVMTEYSPDGDRFYSIKSPEYLEYVRKHCNFYWLKYYVNWIKSFPGRVYRKIRRIVGGI